MCVLSGFKAMTEEETGVDAVVYRTSKANAVLGVLFVAAGIGIISQVLTCRFFSSSFGFCAFSLLVSGLFICGGAVTAAYSKRVLVDFAQQKILLFETGIYGLRSASFHFNDIINVEVAKDSQCLLSSHTGLWVIKIFVSNGKDGFSVEKIFASTSVLAVKNAAETIGIKTGKQPYFTCQPSERLIFGQM